MTDNFANQGENLIAGADRSYLVTPNDGADLPAFSKSISVNGAGDVAYHPIRNDLPQCDTVVTRTLVAGIQHPIRAKRILAAGTNATGIIVDF